ncbi:hypothetical protein BDV96DRAFT_496189 [Lophiotrema nucula]|uniref:Uncharacterized protein n=1 Tax=Lophiotrema nucula TaxID=690887 RepID=A0A6A5Z3V1_9PLEO|nr:hypothetical protein BDV96DRAFT_496189 [Lophiotrema nucula]
MLIRSPRKLLFLSFAAFLFILAVYKQSPWTTSSMYEQMPLFSPRPFNSHGNGSSKTPAVGDAVPGKEKQGPGRPRLPWLSEASKMIPLDYRPPNTTNLKEYVTEMLNWSRPTWVGHWPPFGDYINMEYDPNRWEQFDMDYRIFNSSHDKLDKKVAASPKVYKPLPDYNSKSWKKSWKGNYVACTGPRGIPLNISTDDDVQVYEGVPKEFPPVFAGGYDVVGLDQDVCFDRYSRYGPYGYGDDQFPEDVANWMAPTLVPEWKTVNWGELQDDCLKRNQDRYRPGARTPALRQASTQLPASSIASSAFAAPTGTSRTNMENREDGKPQYHHRTAVLIRAWTGYNYEENDITAIRAMISELSLQSGGEYQVFLYVHVKDRNLKIFDDADLYARVLKKNVPEELRDIAILWSESIFPEWYPYVMDWQVYWQQFMCLQWFSISHPEFDYIWNWETDARYTGHHYHFFEKISEFADKQPRKLLWERNKRYYIPSIHGSYQSFVEQTHSDVLNASANSLIPPPVWGPRPYARADPPQQPLGPTPPKSFEEDDFEWGVNEPADFITLLPMWDPRNTSWSYKDKIWNYLPGIRPIFTPQDGAADWFTHKDFVEIDRRVFINTVVRFSKRMLQAMHEENLVGRSMQAEMWPSTVALQHGLKAVYAPHPIFTDRHWPSTYTSAIFDTSSQINPITGAATEPVQGAWTEQADSPYNHDREYNFQGWSWYYASRFPRQIYRRWLNWKVVFQDWGEDEKVVGGLGTDGKLEEERMCMPAMLLHPVKKMSKEKLKP